MGDNPLDDRGVTLRLAGVEFLSKIEQFLK
jgi:hypothetical protein